MEIYSSSCKRFFWLPKMTNEKTNKQTETSTTLEKSAAENEWNMSKQWYHAINGNSTSNLTLVLSSKVMSWSDDEVAFMIKGFDLLKILLTMFNWKTKYDKINKTLITLHFIPLCVSSVQR